MTEDKLLETAKADTGTDLPAGLSAHCPQVVAWPRDRLLTVYQPGHVGDANAVIHRGEITKMARECQLYSDRVIVKYGFAGRVLLGPKGGPGTVTLGVNVRVAGAQQNTLATDKMNISATIPAGDPAGYFSMVREIAFPIVGRHPAGRLQSLRRLRPQCRRRRVRSSAHRLTGLVPCRPRPPSVMT